MREPSQRFERRGASAAGTSVDEITFGREEQAELELTLSEGGPYRFVSVSEEEKNGEA